ncbi:MAG: MFS transporter [Gammaproteobacteria bacterium]
MNTATFKPTHHYGLTYRGWWVFLSACLFVFFQFQLNIVSGEILGGIMQSFSLTAFTGSLLVSVYFYTYVIMQVPSGMIVDRFGPKRLLVAGSALCGLSCILFSHTHSIWIAAVARLCMGFGSSFAYVGSMNLASRWFPLRFFGLLCSGAEAMGFVGSMLGGDALAAIVDFYGWRVAFDVLAVVAILVCILLKFVVKNEPKCELRQDAIAQTHEDDGHMWKNFKTIVRSKTAWINAVYSGLMFGVFTIFAGLWAVPFFETSHHLNLVHATILSSLMLLGAIFGNLLMGYLDLMLSDRRILTVGCPLIVTAVLLPIIYMPSLPLFWMGTFMFMTGLFGSAYILTFAIGNELAPEGGRSTSIGFVNTLSVGMTPILQPIVGYVLTHLVTTPMQHASDYPLWDYEYALALLPAITLLSALLGFYLPKRKDISITEDELLAST